jgi:hypothetical protein
LRQPISESRARALAASPTHRQPVRYSAWRY